MFDALFATVLATSGVATVIPCESDPGAGYEHLSDVCAEYLEGAIAYSATFGASLAPLPASQQVLIWREGETWHMRIAGYQWATEGLVTTRRREIPISSADAQSVIDLLDEAAFTRLGEISYFGSPLRICSDGANYTIAMSDGISKRSASQHSCAGRTEINGISAAFRALAIKYDPEFTEMLNGLRASHPE